MKRRRKGSASSLSHEPDNEFSALVARQSRFVFRVAYAVLLHAHDAEDAVQETFMKLFRNGGWRGVENERAFLARVAWRVAVDLRARRRLPAEAMDEDATNEWDAPRATEASPEQAIVDGDQHARLHALIDALPEELRVPLVLSAFEELNSREIGEALAIPEGTVRTRLMRARQLLREKFAGLAEAHHA